MIPKNIKKAIISSFFFINFIYPSKTANSSSIYKTNNLRTSKLDSLIISNENNSSILSNILLNKFEETSDKKFLNYRFPLLADISVNKNEIEIQSDNQSEINNKIFAEGNVVVSYRGKILKADNLIYDKLNKKISAKGNVALFLGNQIFKVSQFEYSFIS